MNLLVGSFQLKKFPNAERIPTLAQPDRKTDEPTDRMKAPEAGGAGGRGEAKAESSTPPPALDESAGMTQEATASIADGAGFWKHGLLAPYVPSGKEDIKEALEWAKTHCKGVNEKTKLFDLGSGDGRVVIEAAQKGFYSVGVELDGKLMDHAKQQAKAKGVADRVTFLQQDFLEVLESQSKEMGIVVVYLLSAGLFEIS
eukprot:jgi/Bigna1/133961/aug1.23_g8669